MVQFNDKATNDKIADLRAHEEERLMQSLAPQYGYEYIDLNGYTINPDAMMELDEKSSRDGEIVGFEFTNELLSVAVKNPNNPKTQKILKQLESRRYKTAIFMCSTLSLEHVWERYKDLKESKVVKKGVFEISAEDIIKLTSSIKKQEDVSELLQKIGTINNSRRISETLELVFAGAMSLRASDIHIEPEESGIRLRYRFDGVLHDIADLDSYIYKRLMSRLKLLSGMVLNSKVEAQDGRFTFDAGDRKIEIRSSVIPGAIGESIVMRLLDPGVASFSMEKLHLNPKIAAVMAEQVTRPNGLIITTGPTGSGKTTALYALLQETHSEGVKIITIENPVEYKLDGIVQTQTDEDYTFASGLRAVLRQDPDIIMVGEIRDHEVAETAIHAAQTGHLVFTTLHTNSAVAGFPRLMDLGVDSRILGSSINIILGQRLVRVLCEHCKESYVANEHERASIEFVMENHPVPKEVPNPLNIFRPGACNKCSQTGYKGRAGIFEGIVMDEAVEEAVIRDPREHIILEAAKPQGIPSMVEDGMEKVLLGITSFKELSRVVEIPHAEITTSLPTQKKEPKQLDDDFMSHVI